MRWPRVFLLFATMLAIAVFDPVQAQRAAPAAQPEESAQATVAQINQRRAQLFARMLENPADLDAAFEYALLSAQVGELEAAAATLERMLIFAPGVPRIQLELGVVYFRLKSYNLARTYLSAAISGPNVPFPVRERVAVFLAAIDTAESPSSFSGSITAGLQWQSNANAAPADPNIVLNNLRFNLSDESVAASDFNAYLSAAGYYTHRLNEQNDLLEVILAGYGSKQFDLDQLDTLLGEILIGPSFTLDRVSIDSARFGIYGIAGGVVLGGDGYSSTYGGGARLVKNYQKARFATRVEARQRTYYNSSTSPTLDERSGPEIRGSITTSIFASAETIISFALFGDRTIADADYYKHSEVGAGVVATKFFSSPLNGAGRPWQFTLAGGGLVRKYDEPDPLINAAEKQDDVEAWLVGTLSVPVSDKANVFGSLGVRDRDSNYPTQDYTNVSARVGVTRAF